jgi:hypothetical protein
MELIPGGKQAFGPPFPAFDEAWNATQAFLAEVLE